MNSGALQYTKNLLISENLTVVGTLTAGSQVFQGGTVQGNLDVIGNITSTGDVSVAGNLSTNSFNPQTIQTGSLSTTGDLSVGGDLSVTGNTRLTGPLTFPPPSVVGGPLTGTYITGGSIHSPSLAITDGSTTFAGIDSRGQLAASNILSVGIITNTNARIESNGDITSLGDLGISGAGKIEKDLQVGGDISTTGNIGCIDLTTSGIIANANALIKQNGDIVTSGNASVGQTLDVGGDISTTGKITCIDISSTGNIGCIDLTTSGNILSAGSVSTSGNITADTATISGDSTLGNTPIPIWDSFTSYAIGSQVVDIAVNNVYSNFIPIFANPSNPPPHLAPGAWTLIGSHTISTVTITEACVVGGSLSVTNDTSSDTVTIASRLLNSGTSDLIGDTTIGVVGGPLANLRVTNDLQVDGTLTATTQVFTNATVNGDLTVTGNASFGTAIPSGQRWEEYLGYSIGETAQYFTGSNGVYYTCLQDISALAVKWLAGQEWVLNTIVVYTDVNPYTYWIATQDVPASSTPPDSDPDYWAPDIVTPNPAPPDASDYWKVSANSFLLDGNCTITGDLTAGTFNPPSLTTGFIVLDSTTNAITAAQGTITSHDLVVTKQSTLSDVTCDTLSITNTLSWVLPVAIPTFTLTYNSSSPTIPDVVGAFEGPCGFFDLKPCAPISGFNICQIASPAGYKIVEGQTMCYLQVVSQSQQLIDFVNFIVTCLSGPWPYTGYPELDNGYVTLILNQFNSNYFFRFQYFFVNLSTL